MRSNQRKIICEGDDAKNLLAALKVAMERFRQEDAWAMERGTCCCMPQLDSSKSRSTDLHRTEMFAEESSN
jgi:NADH:ubiquinone oxidoreductase subunit B-like Fe-S oxidoreductase